ncbi:hypothetical protein ACI2IX_04370 [Leifsonia aquatica]|uniref:hypothetical protein n=1 Tax=Leifsonia aquatica TaxID=144185 RepID=UPI00384E7026
MVLVHGEQSDSSSWSEVIGYLERDHVPVQAVDVDFASVERDVERTRAVIETCDGPVLLVGHARAGAVIGAAGAHLHVAGLVYVAACAPLDPIGDAAAAWRSKPCWYIVVGGGQTAPVQQRALAQRMNAVTMELDDTGLPMVTHARAVAQMIMVAVRHVRAMSECDDLQ